jgi:hypothetical protein
MLTKFWGSLGDNLARHWFEASLTPALLFWTIGVVSIVWRDGGFAGTERVASSFQNSSSTVQMALLVAALLVVAASGTAVQRITLPATQLLEGYWPRWADGLRRWLVNRQSHNIDRTIRRFSKLAGRIDSGQASAEERRAFIQLDNRLHRLPAEPEAGMTLRRMPTRLGNILRAAESRPFDKYGLDAVKCWPCFWLVLPESTRKELTEARLGLDTAVAAWVWSTLLWVWVPFNWWVLPLAVVAGPAIYYIWVLSRAELFADLLEASFDLHRGLLYAALRWPLPETAAHERPSGEALTRYLWRGSDDPSQRFV